MVRHALSSTATGTPTPVEHVSAPARRWRIALLAMAGTLAYGNSLTNPFIFDDYVTVVSNPRVLHPVSLIDFFWARSRLPRQADRWSICPLS